MQVMIRSVTQSFTKAELEAKQLGGRTIQVTIEDKLNALGTKGWVSMKWREETCHANVKKGGRHHDGGVPGP